MKQVLERSQRKKRNQKTIVWKYDSKIRRNKISSFHSSKHKKLWISEQKDCKICTSDFQKAISSTLVFAQFLGIMPVVGVKEVSAAKLRFKWKCVRTFYGVIVLSCAIMYTALYYWNSIKQRITFDTFVPLAFFSTTTYGLYRFIVLAKHWPAIMQEWEFVEAILSQFRYCTNEKQLSTRIRNTVCILLSFALVEHCMNIAAILYYSITKTPEKDPIEELFKIQVPLLFTITKFSISKAILSKWFNIIMTFVWSYMDIFVIMISIGLSSLFKHINDDLERIRGKHMNKKFWILRRIQYRQTCLLVRSVDNAISTIILVSFANDLFFICVQLLNSLNPMPSIVHEVYFWFSLSFLIGRTLAVSLYSADIHEESKKPIDVLRDVPRYSYSRETERFSKEVVEDEIALSGLRFFYLTRKLILAVAGTIVTYELVLMQFHHETQ